MRDTLAERAIHWVLPWTVRNYPGLRRGVVELLGRTVTFSAVRGWRSGRRTLPDLAADMLADFIETRSQAGLSLVAELRAHAAACRSRPSQPVGFRVVGDYDGTGTLLRDRRWRGGRFIRPHR